MEAVVVDTGSKFLKVGFTILDQAPSMIIPTQMKHTLEDGPLTDSSLFEDITADLVVRVIAPVIEGAVQHIASRRFEIGGVDLTKLLARGLDKSNPIVNLNITDVERLKEQYSCCAEDELAYENILDVHG
ncbi:hypothetical protein AAG906_010355 [Vitis piasezkii]